MSDLWRAFQALLPIGVVAVAALGCALVWWWRLVQIGRHRAARALALTFCGIWAAGVSLVTLRPRPALVSASGETVTRSIDVVPGRELVASTFNSVSAHVFVEQVVGNVALFLPLGIGLGMLGVAVAGGGRLRLGLIVGAAAGLVVEVLQWVIGTGRVSSVDDIVLAAVGTALGLVAFGRITRGHVTAQMADQPGN
ncbi:VanZ family protein [Marmoricola sp. RAF53]|uniref:VanZ family protein n=1 Tax=Marmoricola sp. RAF53 TaxID=3233059 RepID=UPI003F94789B